MRIPIKKERIFRVLTLQSDLTVSKISQSAQLSKSYVSKTVTELKRDGVVWGTERIFVDYLKLIRKWGDLKRKIFRYAQPLTIDMLILERLKTVVKEYAISGPFAEMLVQGESSGRPLIVYLTEEEMKKKKNQISKLGVIGKGQVWIYTYDKDILSSRWKIRGWKIVNIPQLCADMVAQGTYADLGIKLFQRWLDAGKRI